MHDHALRRLLAGPRVRDAASVLPQPIRSAVRDALLGIRADRQWARTVMNRDLAAVYADFEQQNLDVVEVSGKLRDSPNWRSYTRLEWPGFDLCDHGELPGQYDLVICEQVLEHVPDPWAAVQTLRDLCRPGGHVIVSTPFLLRVHGDPNDYWRFTPDGLRLLLGTAGLEPLWVRSWGNRKALNANLKEWAVYLPWRSLRNEPRIPLVVWTVARAGVREVNGSGSLRCRFCGAKDDSGPCTSSGREHEFKTYALH